MEIPYCKKYSQNKSDFLSLQGKMCVYYIHDNGGRPFKVVILTNNKNSDKKQIKIYKQIDYSEEQEKVIYSPEEILSFDASKVFIGKSPLNAMTEFSGGDGPKFDGNTILLHIKNFEYIFIGTTIFSFTALSTITEYLSPVGNNDVSYPYAVDIDGNIYLLIADVIIKASKKIQHRIKSKEYDNDPYTYYYDYFLITADKGYFPPKNTKLDHFMNINEFLIGNDRYTMTYYPFPEEDYDRFIKSIGHPVSIIDTDNKKHTLSKNDYVKIINAFGKVNSFMPLITTRTYQERL